MINNAIVTRVNGQVVIIVKDKKTGEPIVIRNMYDAARLFDFDGVLLPFLQEEPFFAMCSRYIQKRPSLRIPTCSISFDVSLEQFTLEYNPIFLYELSTDKVKGVLKHEFFHFVCRHLTQRRREPAEAHNIAADAAINSLIVKDYLSKASSTGRTSDIKTEDLPLPGFGVIPGRRPDPVPEHILKKMSAEQIAWNEKFSVELESWPELEATEAYFARIMQFLDENPKPETSPCPIHGKGGTLEKKRQAEKEKQKQQNEKGKKGAGAGADGTADEENSEHDHGDGEEKCGCGAKGCKGDHEGELDDLDQCTCGCDHTLDDHSNWDDIDPDIEDFVKTKAASVVEKAVREADSHKGWGSVPAHMRDPIRRSVSHIVDWRAVLKNFVGKLVRCRKTSSIKKINKKYPYIHPGKKHGYAAKLLVAVDESGSVPNGCVELFFAELASLTKMIDIDIVSFDCECDPKEIVTWPKGKSLPVYRARCGGTDFNAPTRVANDPRNRNRWDGVIILTDGYAPKPVPSRVTRAWGIAPGCKPEFQTDELMFFIEKDTPTNKGSWY